MQVGQFRGVSGTGDTGSRERQGRPETLSDLPNWFSFLPIASCKRKGLSSFGVIAPSEASPALIRILRRGREGAIPLKGYFNPFCHLAS